MKTTSFNKVFLTDIILVLFFVCFFILGDLNSLLFGKIYLISGIASIIHLMIRHKKNDILIIFFLFSISYLLYMIPFYFFDIPYHYLLEYQKNDYTNNVLVLQIVFIRLMFLGIRPDEFGLTRLKLPVINNTFIFNVVILILVVMAPISYVISPPSIGAKYTGEIQSSIWLEYCLIFIIIAGVYSNTKRKKYILILVSLIYVILPFLYSRRLQAIMVVLAIFMLFFRNKIKIKYILIFVIGLFIFMRVYASIRLGEPLTIADSISSVDEDGVMGNNQGGVFVCASTYWGLIQEGTFDWTFRLKSLVGVFTSIFLPASLNFEETYVNFETLKHTAIPGNGGFPSIYLFLWGGYLGFVTGALILNKVLVNKKNSRFVFIYTLFLFSTFPRWHSYNMFILIKMGFWLLFFLKIADSFNKKRVLSI